MRAALLVGSGGPEMLQVAADVRKPEPGVGEVLIEVSACGVNNTDINTRVGWYGEAGWGGGLTFPRIQGADVCGTVTEVGHGVDASLVGGRVLVDPWIRGSTAADWRDHVAYLGSEVDGGFAEYCVAPATNVHRTQCGYSDVELATFPCSWSTALHMLTRVDLTAGRRILITGASGGVGSALVQLAALRGAHVTAVAAGAKADQVLDLGAQAVVARDTPDLPTVARVEHGPFDVVADVVGGPDVPHWWTSLRRGGRFVCSGAIAGATVQLDLRTMYLNDLEFYGASAYPPSVFTELMTVINAERVRPVVAATFDLADIHAAQQAFATKSQVGGYVITL